MAHTNHAPAARGVSQLMYVGDDQATAPSKLPTALTVAIVLAIGWWLVGRRR
jgi:uncharacterized protein (TIGR03382 family)